MSAAIKVLPSADPRAQAVAKFREMADRLESGELRAARIQWREGLEYVEIVECLQAAALDTSLPLVRLYAVSVAGANAGEEVPLPTQEQRQAREEEAWGVLKGLPGLRLKADHSG